MSARRIVAAVAALGLTAGAPLPPPSAGSGEYRTRFGVLPAARAPALSKLGSDVLRVSASPALGGRGWIIEMHAVRHPYFAARGSVTFLATTKTYGDWRVTGKMPLQLTAPEWVRVRGEVGRLLAKGQHDIPDGPGEVRICMDGPNHVVEERSPAGDRWMTGACITSDPTPEIVEVVTSTALDGWCDILRAPQVCRERRDAKYQRERRAEAAP